MVRKGETVSFREIPNFDQLSLEEATRIIYNQLIPACEDKGVMLSQFGNHNVRFSNIAEYQSLKTSQHLFNVERIQKAFSSIPDIVQSTSQYQTGSYGVKRVVEQHPTQDEYITNGDLIIAMLLRGYKARFGKKTERMDVNCDFQVKVRTR